MVYTMEIYTDGGCRHNGKLGAKGAAAAAFKNRNGTYKGGWTQSLPRNPIPTNQRTELTTIIVALELALEKRKQLDTNPYLDVKIYSDSRYTIECMTTWIYKWTKNGWINAAGNRVANRDLLKQASDLDDKLREAGDVDYVWISREQNQYADRLCNDAMDKQ
ncbi:ribonuclease H-like domain-containing protein [Trichoderma velutinum]